MTIALLLLAIIIGYLRKGRLRNLAYLDIKLAPIIILAFIIQMIIYCGYRFDIDAIQSYDVLLHFVSYIILFAGLMGNLDNKWFIIITVGVVCNFLVIFLNGGRMPVSLDAASSIGMSVDKMNALLSSRAGTHQELQAGALLWFLSDIIPVSFPGMLKFFGNIYSIGDFVLYAGMTGLIQSAMVQHRKEEEDEVLILDEVVPMREFKSFNSENHMDEIYINDHIQSQTQEEAIVLNVEQAHNEEVEINSSTDKIDLIKQDEEFEEMNKDQDDDVFHFNNTSIVHSDEEQIQESVLEESLVTQQYEEVVEQGEETIQDELVKEETPPEEIVLEEVDFDEGVVDTIHQFIIVDGKIKKNLNYNKNQPSNLESPVEESIEIQNRVIKLEEQVEELEMTQVEIKPKIEKEDTDNKHLLQKITDNERVELMKQMKERKEKGYSLVEVEVGSKKINFWKKDL